MAIAPPIAKIAAPVAVGRSNEVDHVTRLPAQGFWLKKGANIRSAAALGHVQPENGREQIADQRQGYGDRNFDASPLQAGRVKVWILQPVRNWFKPAVCDRFFAIYIGQIAVRQQIYRGGGAALGRWSGELMAALLKAASRQRVGSLRRSPPLHHLQCREEACYKNNSNLCHHAVATGDFFYQ